MPAEKLWCDLKTDQEKADYLRSGKAWEQGIIAKAIESEVADAFEFKASKAGEEQLRSEE